MYRARQFLRCIQQGTSVEGVFEDLIRRSLSNDPTLVQDQDMVTLGEQVDLISYFLQYQLEPMNGSGRSQYSR